MERWRMTENRRDFTINAMAICLNKDRFGELVDPFDGVYDMEDGIIATPLDPDITFSDDPLRMMRCVRFATQLNFRIEEETYDALSRNAERLKIISAERICDEMNKIMLSKHPSSGFYYLKDTGLLDLILPNWLRWTRWKPVTVGHIRIITTIRWRCSRMCVSIQITSAPLGCSLPRHR